jgi:hypothetical protein
MGTPPKKRYLFYLCALYLYSIWYSIALYYAAPVRIFEINTKRPIKKPVQGTLQCSTYSTCALQCLYMHTYMHALYLHRLCSTCNYAHCTVAGSVTAMGWSKRLLSNFAIPLVSCVVMAL